MRKNTRVKKQKSSKQIEKTMNKLQMAALEVFSKNGFSPSTTRMIAKKAKVNAALIARYFGSKEGLFISLIKSEIQRLKTGEASYPPQDTLEKELRAFVQMFLNEVETNKKFIKVVLFQSLTDPKFAANIKQHLIFTDERLKSRLILLQKQGAIKSDIDVEQIESTMTTFFRGVCVFDTLIFSLDTEHIKQAIGGIVNVVVELYATKR